jgi:hypothetical protein
MMGHVRVTFCREPSYFDAAVVEGSFFQTLVARDLDRIVALGCRSVRWRFVNGRPEGVGYLSGLRLHPEYRRTGLLARGYRQLQALHRDGRTKIYLTTIAEGNETALELLTSGRAALPQYHFAGMFHTFVLPLSGRKNPWNRSVSDVTIRPASANDIPTIVAFLNQEGPLRQFYPMYDSQDFARPNGTFRDMKPADLLLAFRGGRLVGTLAAWDQRGFRQTVVEGYSDHLRWTRPFVNGWARLKRLPTLPKPGQPFAFLTAALPTVAENDKACFALLVRALLQRCARRNSQKQSLDHMLLGLHERDPLLPVAQEFASHVFLTRLYLVCWDDGEASLEDLDDRPPYLELGCL